MKEGAELELNEAWIPLATYECLIADEDMRTPDGILIAAGTSLTDLFPDGMSVTYALNPRYGRVIVNLRNESRKQFEERVRG